MSYQRSVFNSISDEEENQRRRLARNSYSDNGQSFGQPSWNIGTPTLYQEPGFYAPSGTTVPSTAYPHTVYTQGVQSLSYGNPRPQTLPYEDPRSMPTNYIPETPGPMPLYPSRSYGEPVPYNSTPYPNLPASGPNPTSRGHRNSNQYPNNAGYPTSHNVQIHVPEASTDHGRASGDGRECSNCRTTSTPVWRRDPRTHKVLCNACGIYLTQRQQARPQKLIDVDNEVPVGGDSDGEYDGPECDNCGTRKTPTWRRNRAGAQVCNACGVYERMNDGKARPLVLRNDKIRPREKH